MKPLDQNHIRLRKHYDELVQAGITLSPYYTFEDLMHVMNAHFHGHSDMMALLTALGGAYGQPPNFNMSDNIWMFEIECIEEPHAYADIAYHMDALTAPHLNLTNIRSDVDFQKGTAWLNFTCQEVEYHWDLTVEDNWADLKVIDQFCHLLQKVNPTQALAIFERDQTHFFVYTDKPNLERIAQATGLSWKWLENEPA
jgi:hypothetical protein